MRNSLLITLFAALLYSSCTSSKPETAKAVNIIFDTDMGPDYDDVGAITLLHKYAADGRANILATMASTKYERVGPVLSVLNTYFGKPDIPIGVPREDASPLGDWQHWSDTLVAKYPHKLKSNTEAAEVISLYRQILAKQPDSSVTIVTVGFFNNIANLLKSQPDQYSPLNGEQLVENKVAKLVSMAGKFPQGREFNVDEQPAASKYVFDNWKKPIYFTGYEIGAQIFTGLPLVQNKEIKNSPVQDVFRISIPMAKEDVKGRMSWDQTAVLLAVEGPKTYWRLQQGTIKVTADGENSWENSPAGKHFYLVPVTPPQQVQDHINDLMLYHTK
ncbi:nucleoside hydrolase [Mucilaginibacter conchicola]|uniref:Nucleoside hydrolase n=1 Tax=Mucilaginibacter conchicola TaxID=2303333 RepID=A0A372NVQ1_9SPHI|nr:nucleoside hydrolase [Mucilaginibacter conchicola]RFZ93994.1 nucleoside hydrolase [Mucilaginibacter conchicola]